MCGRGVVGEMEMCVGRGLWGRWRGERGMKEMEKRRQRKGSLVKGWGGKKKNRQGRNIKEEMENY